MSAEQLTTIVVAVLGGGFTAELIRSLAALIKGRGTRRSELERAWEKADTEARNRRVVEEHSSQLRRLLLEAPCVDSATIPAYPTYSKKEES